MPISTILIMLGSKRDKKGLNDFYLKDNLKDVLQSISTKK